MRNSSLAAIGALTLILSGASSLAIAAVVTVHLDANIYSSPYTIDLGSGSLTFSTVDPSAFSFNPDGVQTTGTAQVFSTFGAPADFFSNRGGSFPTGQLGQFASYSTATAIPYSLSEGLVGFEFMNASGTHYGYADLAGSSLIGYRYNDTAGADVLLSPVPEPASWVLVLGGFFGLGAGLRSGRRVPAKASSSKPRANR